MFYSVKAEMPQPHDTVVSADQENLRGIYAYHPYVCKERRKSFLCSQMVSMQTVRCDRSESPAQDISRASLQHLSGWYRGRRLWKQWMK